MGYNRNYKIIGAVGILVFIVVIVKQYVFSKEHFQAENILKPFYTYANPGEDGLPNDISKYKTYFTEKGLAATRIHAYKVLNTSSWSEYNLQRFDQKNFVTSNKNPIDRISFLNHDKRFFKDKYDSVHKPCIITDMVNDWPAMKLWSFKYLNENYGKNKFAIQDNEIKFKYWHHYATHPKHRQDDDPIYIFDQRFLERKGTNKLANDYEVPAWFDEDDLAKLPVTVRPPYAWLIIGIPRSGSSLHTDPLGTHAWNTLVCGKKRWVLFPPETKIKDEHTELSGHLWFNNILPKLKNEKHYDFIQGKGDTIFLPANWWHITLVIEDSICVTQNYVGKSNMKLAKDSMMKERPKVYKYWMEKKGIIIPDNQRFIREDAFDSTDSDFTDSDSDSESN